MFDKYSYKTKFQALIIISLMLSYTAYKRSFSTLIEVYKENNALTDKLAVLNGKSKNVELLTSELESIDKILGKEGLNKEKIQQDIISFITSNNLSTSIYDMQSTHEFKDSNHVVFTNSVDVTGNLNQLLALAYDFEKKFDSRLISIKLYTDKKHNKPDVLHLKMIFQNYENIK